MWIHEDIWIVLLPLQNILRGNIWSQGYLNLDQWDKRKKKKTVKVCDEMIKQEWSVVKE